MRGEHSKLAATGLSDPGSSPRARGALSGSRTHVPSVGIIPACAGSTPGICPCRRVRGDHPRVRGEHWWARIAAAPGSGSSPRARGARSCDEFAPGIRGIIPACAGSTSYMWRVLGAAKDHPRVRGEHTRAHFPHDSMWGSSPRARGARGDRPVFRRAPGIIPACAGSTRTRSTWRPRARDHPRVRGEHRVGADQGYEMIGIIPACAGSTTCQ